MTLLWFRNILYLLLSYECVTQTLAHYGVGVLDHRVHRVGEVILQGPRQAERLEVQPQLTDAGLGGADLEVAGSLLCGVEGEVGGVLECSLPTAGIEDAAGAEAAGTAALGRPAQAGALAGGVARPIAAQAGLALRVGELHHGEHVQQAGAAN